MSLTERLAGGPQPSMHGAPCSVGELLDTLPSEEAEALQQMLDDGWPAPHIHDAVSAEGHYIGRQTINTHRRGQCRCGPGESS